MILSRLPLKGVGVGFLCNEAPGLDMRRCMVGKTRAARASYEMRMKWKAKTRHSIV